MAQAALIPNIKITDEYGASFHNAMVLILKVRLNDSWSMESDGEDQFYEENSSVGGGTYEVWYYCTPEARAKGAPIKPLRTYEDGEFSNVLILDTDSDEISQLLSNPAENKDKAQAIVLKDLELKFK
jgi:hypothetical protein